MARGAENQLRLVNVPGIPTLGDESVGRWDGRERFSPEGFNVGGHLYAPIRQKAPFGPIYRRFIAINHLEWVPYLVNLLFEWFWLAMASQTWCVEAKVVWGSNLAFGRFGRFGRLCARCYARPSCPNYPGEASLVRPRTQSRGLLRQVPQSGRGLCRYKCSKLPISRFVQLSVMPPRSRLFKSGGPRDRCNTNLGPNLRLVNSKAANFLYKCAQNCQKGVMCVRAESTIRVKAL